MMELPDRQSIRLRGFDYSSEGLYFVTICTDGRADALGKIHNGKMVINNVGMLVDYWWQQISQKFQNVELDYYQIMPNHLHGILNVGARSSRPNQEQTHPNDLKIPTLGQIIAFFKYESTKSINNLPGGKTSEGGKTPPLRNLRLNLKFWQRNFYERIIRDENEYQKIVYYIQTNPQNWDRDKNNIHIIPQ